MMRRIKSLVFLGIITAASDCWGQDTNNGLTGSLSGPWTWQPEHYLVLIFCILGLLVLIMQFMLFNRALDRVSVNDVIRAFSTVLILIAVVALVGVGYSERQVQPAYGLIGTLLGYVLGRGALAGDQRDAAHRPRRNDPSKPEDS